MYALEEKEALTMKDLDNMIPFKVNFIPYDSLRRMQLSDVFNGTDYAIILLDIHNGRDVAPVGHWIALLRYPDHIEHFDSYGLSVDSELAFTHDGSYLTGLLNGNLVIENTKRLQKFREDTNTCGRWCVVRCLEKDRTGGTLQEFLKLFDEIDLDNDLVVTLMTLYHKRHEYANQ